MPVTRIKTNQLTDNAVTSAKIAALNVTAVKLENNMTYGSNLTVSGNLTVNGTTTTVDTTNTSGTNLPPYRPISLPNLPTILPTTLPVA